MICAICHKPVETKAEEVIVAVDRPDYMNIIIHRDCKLPEDEMLQFIKNNYHDLVMNYGRKGVQWKR